MTKEQILKQADVVAEQIARLTEQERELRKKAAEMTSPNKVWDEIINGLTIKIDREKYPNSIFFFKEDKLFFELQNSTLWCRYSTVWMKISEVISGDYGAIQAFIEKQVEEHFKMRGVTPMIHLLFSAFLVEEHFKMRGVTPVGF
jgi:hypothetical protein